VGSLLQVSIPSGFLTGRVETIGLGYTALRDGAGHEIIFTNSVMATSVIVRLDDDASTAPAAAPAPASPA